MTMETMQVASGPKAGCRAGHHRMDERTMRQPKLRPSAAVKAISASPLVFARGIKPQTTARLYGKAAGRCEFCNKDTLAHSLTLQDGTFAEQAHIVAFKEAGPRGMQGERPADINAVENL